MKVKYTIILLLITFGYYGQCEGKDFNYNNLEGLKSVNELMPIEIKVSGNEPFNIDEIKIKEIIKKELQDIKIQVDNTNNANANLLILIEGETTGGGGARFLVRITMLSRVFSPFKEDNKISAIIWSTEIHEEQVMSFDPEKKELVRVKGKLNDRVYNTVEEAMRKLQSDFRKANLS